MKRQSSQSLIETNNKLEAPKTDREIRMDVRKDLTAKLKEKQAISKYNFKKPASK